MNDQYRADIDAAAGAHALDPDLLYALVWTESDGYPFAHNPEPRYRWFWDCRLNKPFRAPTANEIASQYPPRDFHDMRGYRGIDADSEWWNQQASFGLCQVMGAVAREMGFKGVSLLELVKVDLNLELGARLLASHLRWAAGDVSRALGAYNAGRGGWSSDAGQRYAGKVLAKWRQVGERRSA